MILDAIFLYTNGQIADALGDVMPDYEDLRRTMKHVKTTPGYLLQVIFSPAGREQCLGS